jgi:hypothetical protein
MADATKTASEATDEDRQEAEDLTAQWVIDRLMAAADADFSELIETDAYGFPSVNLELLTPKMRLAIQEVTSSSYKGNKRITIKPMDKLKALDMLGKYLAMFKDKVTIEGEISLVARLQEGRARMNREVEDALKKSEGQVRVKSQKEP